MPRVLALASTGGAVVLGAHPSLQLATADWADVSYVDCVAQVRGGVITGHCCKSEPLKALRPQKRRKLGDASGEKGRRDGTKLGWLNRGQEALEE